MIDDLDSLAQIDSTPTPADPANGLSTPDQTAQSASVVLLNEPFSSIPSPRDLVISPSTLGAVLLACLILLILIGFPAELVNKTIEENEEYFTFRLNQVRTLLARIPGIPGQAARMPTHNQSSSVISIGSVLVLIAFLTVLSDRPSSVSEGLSQGVGTLAAEVLTLLVYGNIVERLDRRYSRTVAPYRVIPWALLPAIAMALLSYMDELSPPYVYGVVAGYMCINPQDKRARQEVAPDRSSIPIVVGAFGLFVLGIVMFALLIPVRAAFPAQDVSTVAIIIRTFVNASVALPALLMVFGLLPLSFMDGERLKSWNIGIWATVYMWGLTPLVLLLMGQRWDTIDGDAARSLVRSIGFFIFFAVSSCIFWLFFRLRKKYFVDRNDIDSGGSRPVGYV